MRGGVLLEAVSRATSAAAWLAVAALVCCGCSARESAAGASFESRTPGVLRVATAFLPAPGFWEGHPPTGGFEARLARALAHKLGLGRIAVVQVPFAQIIQGKLHGADIALSQLTPTDERRKHVDFTDPYLTSPPGVLLRAGVDAIDVHELQQLRWVVSSASTLTPIVTDRIRPEHDPLVVVDRAQALRVLRSGRADALLLDLPVALGLVRAQPKLFHVPAQLDGEEDLAAALPKGSRNDEVVDSAIRALIADGTVHRLASRWLGQSQEDVPLILTEQS
jgi:ABC-type amino acid transport substrate-binding protein